MHCNVGPSSLKFALKKKKEYTHKLKSYFDVTLHIQRVFNDVFGTSLLVFISIKKLTIWK